MDSLRSGGLPRWAALSACGDAAVILLFAAIGRSSHHAAENGQILGAVGTAAPFLAGWFLSAFAFGGYRADALSSPGAAARRAARVWIPGGLIGCAVRSAIEGHITPAAFVAIALGFNLVLLAAWRAALTRALQGLRPGSATT
jgi:hypothetical protein